MTCGIKRSFCVCAMLLFWPFFCIGTCKSFMFCPNLRLVWKNTVLIIPKYLIFGKKGTWGSKSSSMADRIMCFKKNSNILNAFFCFIAAKVRNCLIAANFQIIIRAILIEVTNQLFSSSWISLILQARDYWNGTSYCIYRYKCWVLTSRLHFWML